MCCQSKFSKSQTYYNNEGTISKIAKLVKVTAELVPAKGRHVIDTETFEYYQSESNKSIKYLKVIITIYEITLKQKSSDRLNSPSN